jgi:hypothetical protein
MEATAETIGGGTYCWKKVKIEFHLRSPAPAGRPEQRLCVKGAPLDLVE